MPKFARSLLLFATLGAVLLLAFGSGLFRKVGRHQSVAGARHATSTGVHKHDHVQVKPDSSFERVQLQSHPVTELIDGALHPELIPDDLAFEMVFLVASTNDNPTPLARIRAAVVIKNLNLSLEDSKTFGTVAQQCRKALAALRGTIPDESAYQSARLTLILNSISTLKGQLSSFGMVQVRAKVNDAKHHIKLFPIPNMTQSGMGFIQRFFSLPTVHAQQMSPYGSTYTNLSVDDSTETFYGTSVTNGDSSCQCHQSSVGTEFYGPAGEWMQGPNDVEVEYAEVDQSWTWDDGTLGTVYFNSTNVAYCPWAGYNFIDSGASTSGMSFSPIQHTYPSNPLPQACRITSWFDAVRSSKAHHAEDLVFDNGNGGSQVPPYGTPVTAMESGTVVAAVSGNGPAATPYPNCQGAPGNYVKIRTSDGYFTVYFHMTPTVNTGDQVSAGQTIGNLDPSGCQTAAHLHVARKDPNNTPVNFKIPCVNPLPTSSYDDGTVEDDVPDDI